MRTSNTSPSNHETVSSLCRFDLRLGLCFRLIAHFLDSLFELFFVFFLLLKCLICGFESTLKTQQFGLDMPLSSVVERGT